MSKPACRECGENLGEVEQERRVPLCHECDMRSAGVYTNRRVLEAIQSEFWELPNGNRVEVICGEGVYIYDKHDEVMSWNSDEWQEDPESITATVNAVLIAALASSDSVRKLTGRKVMEKTDA